MRTSRRFKSEEKKETTRLWTPPSPNPKTKTKTTIATEAETTPTNTTTPATDLINETISITYKYNLTEMHETAAELHLKMCKKVAQLTRVIFYLNTKNDDYENNLKAVVNAY